MKSYEALVQPIRPKSAQALFWGAVNRISRAAAALSRGMAIGYRYGFDSGPMLDYVYANRAHGKWGVGVVLDRLYLNAIGWRGIRQRKINLKRLLQVHVAYFHAGGRAVHVVDLAAGPGRYLLETLQAIDSPQITATLRDWDEEGLRQGRALAQGMGLACVRYERGDAFNPASIASIKPQADIVVVSGLYELFADNDKIRQSLRGIIQLLRPGGRLIYTNQPYHPQLELIARALVNREGKPWVMRLRTQEEMDGLVKEAGLVCRDRVIDRWGMYTVSVAEKPVMS